MIIAEADLPARIAQFRALSLDVFDTALTRACGAPQDLYLWLGRRLFQRGVIRCTPEVFARARARAEREVWYRAGGMDARVTLEDFYHELTRWLWLGSEMVPLLVDAELELEAETLRPVPAAAGLIVAAQESGARVVFTSDTYFGADFIADRLQGHGLWTGDARCIASIDHKRSKAGGTLFQTLFDTLQIAPCRIVHAGDNPHSDLRVPRGLGVSVCWLAQGRLNRFEELLSAAAWATSGLSAALAGASRLARLKVAVEGEREAALRDVAAGVAAPVLIGYVLWLLHRAHDAGLPRLYFIARDGQVMADVARTLVERLGWSIEIRYLYASRRTTNLAATFNGNQEELGWVFRDRALLSPPQLLARFDLGWEELSDQLQDVDPRASSTSDDAAEAIRKALCSERGRRLLLERAAARRVLINSYLQQEGLLDGTPCGLVDFGGVGSQIRALHDLMVRCGAPAPSLFLVGLDSLEDAGLPSLADTPQWLLNTECYLYDHRRRRGIRRRRGFGTCVQMFCAADHGTVCGYERHNGRIEPVLSPAVDHDLIAWGLPLLRRSVREVLAELVIDDELVDLRADLRDVSCALIEEFWSRPAYAEAVAWGAYPFVGAEAAGSAGRPLAQRYSWNQIARQIVQRRFPNLGWQHWYEGSVRQSGPLLRLTLQTAYRTYRRLERRASSRAQRTTRLLKRVLGRN